MLKPLAAGNESLTSTCNNTATLQECRERACGPRLLIWKQDWCLKKWYRTSILPLWGDRYRYCFPNWSGKSRHGVPQKRAVWENMNLFTHHQLCCGQNKNIYHRKKSADYPEHRWANTCGTPNFIGAHSNTGTSILEFSSEKAEKANGWRNGSIWCRKRIPASLVYHGRSFYRTGGLLLKFPGKKIRRIRSQNQGSAEKIMWPVCFVPNRKTQGLEPGTRIHGRRQNKSHPGRWSTSFVGEIRKDAVPLVNAFNIPPPCLCSSHCHVNLFYEWNNCICHTWPFPYLFFVWGQNQVWFGGIIGPDHLWQFLA